MQDVINAERYGNEMKIMFRPVTDTLLELEAGCDCASANVGFGPGFYIKSDDSNTYVIPHGDFNIRWILKDAY